MPHLQSIFNLALSIYRHFDTPPAVIDRKYYRFYIVSNVAQTFAWSPHSIWMLLFWIIGIYPMVGVQF